MKKIISIILICLILTISGCGCHKKQGNEIYDSFVVIDRIKNDLYIVYDKKTKIMYYLNYEESASFICPYYNSDGTIGIYKGE